MNAHSYPRSKLGKTNKMVKSQNVDFWLFKCQITILPLEAHCMQLTNGFMHVGHLLGHVPSVGMEAHYIQFLHLVCFKKEWISKWILVLFLVEIDFVIWNCKIKPKFLFSPQVLKTKFILLNPSLSILSSSQNSFSLHKLMAVPLMRKIRWTLFYNLFQRVLYHFIRTCL